MDLTQNTTFIRKNEFGQNSDSFGDGSVLAFQYDSDKTKTITMISLSFSKAGALGDFHQGAVAVVRSTVEAADLPLRFSELTKERIELLEFFDSFEGVRLPCFITGGTTDKLSVILYPAITDDDLTTPATLYGSLNVFGALGEAKAQFTVKD